METPAETQSGQRAATFGCELAMLSLLCRRVGVKRKRGGWRQQLEQSDSEEYDEQGISRLAAGHLLEWCDGETSASRVVNHMRNASLDGFAHPMVAKIAKAGVGQHAQAGL
eukprot:2147838-Alexandrium_andersonii.AAC.1